ncbi:MAG: helix-turn-helix domain-containing protein [Lachnospiraceae bacterium]|nr:helix-turn-helix domain-containing protein [Lachnospiraceae bacterium]
MNSELFERIEFELDKRGLYRADLSRITGINEANFRNWKRGTMPAADALYKVAEQFDVSMEYLLTGKHKTKNVELSDREKTIIDSYRSLSEHDKDIFYKFIKLLCDQYCDQKTK